MNRRRRGNSGLVEQIGSHEALEQLILRVIGEKRRDVGRGLWVDERQQMREVVDVCLARKVQHVGDEARVGVHRVDVSRTAYVEDALTGFQPPDEVVEQESQDGDGAGVGADNRSCVGTGTCPAPFGSEGFGPTLGWRHREQRDLVALWVVDLLEQAWEEELGRHLWCVFLAK